MTRPSAGSIVLVDWRGGALPREPSKIRPAVVVEDHRLFPDEYPNIVVVPLTRDQSFIIPAFAEHISPSLENGASNQSWAVANHVSTVSLQRVELTRSRISNEQLINIRRRIALTLGL